MAGTLGRIQYTLSGEEAAAASDLVVEAIVENMGLKHTLFKTLDKAAPRYYSPQLLPFLLSQFRYKFSSSFVYLLAPPPISLSVFLPLLPTVLTQTIYSLQIVGGVSIHDLLYSR